MAVDAATSSANVAVGMCSGNLVSSVAGVEAGARASLWFTCG